MCVRQTKRRRALVKISKKKKWQKVNDKQANLFEQLVEVICMFKVLVDSCGKDFGPSKKVQRQAKRKHRKKNPKWARFEIEMSK